MIIHEEIIFDGSFLVFEMSEQQIHTLIKLPITEDMKLSESSNVFAKSVHQMICHKIAIGYVCFQTTIYNVIL